MSLLSLLPDCQDPEEDFTVFKWPQIRVTVIIDEDLDLSD